MLKIKTAELTGAALDWAVAKCEGLGLGPKGFVVYYHEGQPAMWQPSTNWAQSGPIIERECLSIECTRTNNTLGIRWAADSSLKDYCTQFADNPLIAAMRCYVASKLGDEIEIPKEIKQC